MHKEYLIIYENSEKTKHIFFSTEEELLKEIEFINKLNQTIKEREYKCSEWKIWFAGKIKTEMVYCSTQKKLLHI